VCVAVGVVFGLWAIVAIVSYRSFAEVEGWRASSLEVKRRGLVVIFLGVVVIISQEL
jgi:hypothetical protein